MLSEKQWLLLQKYRKVGYVIEGIVDSMWKPAATHYCCIYIFLDGYQWELQVSQDDILQIASERYVILLVRPIYQIKRVGTSIYRDIRRSMLACMFDNYRLVLFGVPGTDASDNPSTGESSLSWYSETIGAFRTCTLEPGSIMAEPVYDWQPFMAKQIGVDLDSYMIRLSENTYQVSHTSKNTGWHRSYETISRLDLVQDYLLLSRAEWEGVSASEFYQAMKLGVSAKHQCRIVL